MPKRKKDIAVREESDGKGEDVVPDLAKNIAKFVAEDFQEEDSHSESVIIK